MTTAIPFPLREPQIKDDEKPKPFQPNLNIRLICPDCRVDPPQIVEEFASGDLVCGDCGLVLGDRIIDTRSEWRTFANDEGDDPSRVGAAANPLLDGNQLDTVISRRDGGTGAAKDLNKVHGRATAVKGERNLVQAYKEISAMCDSISLSKIVSDTAKQLYKRVEDEKLLRGKSSDAIIAACIFIACRQEKVGRTFREICALTRVPKKEIGRCYKSLQAKLQTNTSIMNSEDLMLRFCSNLQLPNYVQKAGIDLVKHAKEHGTLAGKSPISVAAACIYLVSYLYRQPKSTRDIAHVAGVSEVTIKSAYKSLYAERFNLVHLEELKSRPNGEGLSFEDLPLP
ncbi:cyclin-like protein [Cokeromyces recurvatus]|uniref:cyclin-like protein n=1 Tax=Cokeromyces recurvatus TaxID=90255 RepID=UPI0022209D6F|nr:cyclin-like protein [Cokeromyces recurvatus]KAI7903985.1 cyclin-like protein [Cokeromyces recurvatus]